MGRKARPLIPREYEAPAGAMRRPKEYEDISCRHVQEVHGVMECLECPLPQCLLDIPLLVSHRENRKVHPQIVELHNAGYKQREIAEKLEIGIRTVQRHLNT